MAAYLAASGPASAETSGKNLNAAFVRGHQLGERRGWKCCAAHLIVFDSVKPK